MQRMKQAAWIAVATLLLSGCARHKQESSIAFARTPQLKSGKTAYASSRKQEQAPEPPRILPETYYAAGRVFEQQGAPDKAIEQYRKAIAVNHEYAAAYARLGLMLSLTGQHEESAESFTRAVELKPASAIVRNNLGFELLYLERWDLAERHLREAARLDTKLTQAHINLGLLLGRTQRPEQAIQAFRQVLAEPDAYYNLGLLQRAQGQYAQAAATFQHVLAINPKFTAAQRQLAQVERKIVTIEPAIDQPTTNPTVEQTATSTAIRSTETTTETPTAATALTGATEPFVDLSALIDNVFANLTDPTINQTTMTLASPTPAIAETAPVVQVGNVQPDAPTSETRQTRTVHLDAPTLGAIEPISKREVVPPTETPAPAEAPKPANTPATKEVVREEPTAQAAPTPPQETIDAPQPLRWDLTLADIAGALNIADDQQGCLQQLAAISGQLGPVPAQAELVADATLGPPAPPGDEVVLVLGTSETKPEFRTEPIRSKLTAVSELSTEGQKSMRTLDEMETSLQIIRNEIECQREFGFSTIDTATPTSDSRAIPVNYTPVDASGVPQQRTDSWRSRFGVFDDLLTNLSSKAGSVARSASAANENTRATDDSEKQVESDESGGQPTLAAPTQKPRRHRGNSTRRSRR